MSTSLLYHAYGISGVQYQSTKFEAGIITIHAAMIDLPQCKCGCSRTIFKGQKSRQFKMVPFGGKPCFLNVLLHRVACSQCGHKWWPRLPFMKGKFRMVRSMIAHVLDLLHFSTLLDQRLPQINFFDPVREFLKLISILEQKQLFHD